MPLAPTMAAPKFLYFPWLPQEIQDMIWELALDDTTGQPNIHCAELRIDGGGPRSPLGQFLLRGASDFGVQLTTDTNAKHSFSATFRFCELSGVCRSAQRALKHAACQRKTGTLLLDSKLGDRFQANFHQFKAFKDIDYQTITRTAQQHIHIPFSPGSDILCVAQQVISGTSWASQVLPRVHASTFKDVFPGTEQVTRIAHVWEPFRAGVPWTRFNWSREYSKLCSVVLRLNTLFPGVEECWIIDFSLIPKPQQSADSLHVSNRPLEFRGHRCTFVPVTQDTCDQIVPPNLRRESVFKYQLALQSARNEGSNYRPAHGFRSPCNVGVLACRFDPGAESERYKYLDSWRRQFLPAVGVRMDNP
ncbi:hypothetical protein OQA88_9388 [Cercophora sp. LCS_1]